MDNKNKATSWNIRCECTGRILLKSKLDNGQYNFECESCNATGFIFEGEFFYSADIEIKEHKLQKIASKS